MYVYEHLPSSPGQSRIVGSRRVDPLSDGPSTLSSLYESHVTPLPHPSFTRVHLTRDSTVPSFPVWLREGEDKEVSGRTQEAVRTVLRDTPSLPRGGPEVSAPTRPDSTYATHLAGPTTSPRDRGGPPLPPRLTNGPGLDWAIYLTWPRSAQSTTVVSVGECRWTRGASWGYDSGDPGPSR